ncbi:hypothetical protein LJB88_04390 [Erysipelotrichaceae bacterium OttesenSCG-928-M19]|nr:hypothetical protein [Erysipelotrichaceae bacterium OttesenSCG-928-M19]
MKKYGLIFLLFFLVACQGNKEEDSLIKIADYETVLGSNEKNKNKSKDGNIDITLYEENYDGKMDNNYCQIQANLKDEVELVDLKIIFVGDDNNYRHNCLLQSYNLLVAKKLLKQSDVDLITERVQYNYQDTTFSKNNTLKVEQVSKLNYKRSFMFNDIMYNGYYLYNVDEILQEVVVKKANAE